MGNVLRGRGNVGYADCGILVRGGGVGDGVASKNLIDSNEVFGTVNGILSTSVSVSNGAPHTWVFSNYVHDCNQGIYIDRSPSCWVAGNIVVSNGVGIKVRSRETSQGLSSAGTVLIGNIVSNNIVGGLFVACSGVSVGGDESNPNDFIADDIGILVDYEGDNTGTPVINL
ncbi:MAG: NosD domain-containing protein [Candidatus Fervidibacter sp.]|uniref:NosD domain-containing protein n=1 Tax=Candidatus Fervidibacter sp. TaxID=3100871 RepID=UPI004049C3FD